MVQRNAKLSKFASEFAKISNGFDNYENSRSLSWPGRLVKPGGEDEKAKEEDHLFLSDRAIFARIVQVTLIIRYNTSSYFALKVIEDSGEVKGDDKQEERGERRVGEEVDGSAVAGFVEENLVERSTSEPPVGSLTCWARYAICLTRFSTELVLRCQN